MSFLVEQLSVSHYFYYRREKMKWLKFGHATKYFQINIVLVSVAYPCTLAVCRIRDVF